MRGTDGTARPTGFLRPNSRWSRLVRTQSDHRLWETAVLFHLRGRVRAVDVWLARSRRYGDIRKALLSAAAIADADRCLPAPATVRTTGSPSARFALDEGLRRPPRRGPVRSPAGASKTACSASRGRKPAVLGQRGDRLVVSELSRLGRSLGQIVTVLDAPRQGRGGLRGAQENIRCDLPVVSDTLQKPVERIRQTRLQLLYRLALRLEHVVEAGFDQLRLRSRSLPYMSTAWSSPLSRHAWCRKHTSAR